MFLSLITACHPCISHVLTYVIRTWVALQSNKVYAALSDAAPGLI